MYAAALDQHQTLFPGRNTTIHVSSQQGFSYQKQFNNGFGSRIFPFHTIMIHVQDGIVSDVTWNSDISHVFCDYFNQQYNRTHPHNTISSKNIHKQQYDYDGTVVTTTAIDDDDDDIDETTMPKNTDNTDNNICYLSSDECHVVSTTFSTKETLLATTCDINLNIIWTGTDSLGQDLLSSPTTMNSFCNFLDTLWSMVDTIHGRHVC